MKIKWHVVFKFEAVGRIAIKAENKDEAKDHLFEKDFQKLFAECSTIRLSTLSVTEDISEWEKLIKH